MVMVMFVVEEEEELTSRALLTFNTQPGVIGLFSSIICGQALEHGRILGGKFLNVQWIIRLIEKVSKTRYQWL